MRTHFIDEIKKDFPQNRAKWVPAAALRLHQRLDAESFIFAASTVSNFIELRELGGRVVEGWRVPKEQKQALVVYRPSDIQGMALSPDQRATAPAARNRHAVGPGDVVISKFLPVRAAWVTTGTPRHPVDANGLRVVGLEMAAGFWLTCLLNHPVFAESLERYAGSKTVGRIGLKDIDRLQIPAPPPGIKGLAESWQMLVEKRFATLGELKELVSHIDHAVSDHAEPQPHAGIRGFFPALHLDKNWLPAHVILRGYQAKLAERGWLRLDKWLITDSQRHRRSAPEHGRVLRLSDAEGKFGFRLPPLESLTTPGFRIYAEPLQPDEVLLSLLSSSPKVVFHHPPSDEVIWVSDHWVRFTPQSSPGALALLLRSQPVQWQLAHASSGLVRQFLTQEDAADIRIPMIEAAQAASIHRKLCLLLEELEAVRSQQQKLRAQVHLLIDEQLRSKR